QHGCAATAQPLVVELGVQQHELIAAAGSLDLIQQPEKTLVGLPGFEALSVIALKWNERQDYEQRGRGEAEGGAGATVNAAMDQPWRDAVGGAPGRGHQSYEQERQKRGQIPPLPREHLVVCAGKREDQERGDG